MSESDLDNNSSNGSGLADKNDGSRSGSNGDQIIEVTEIAEYIAEMLQPLSKLAGETGMELLSLLIDFAAKEAHNIKDSNTSNFED